MGKKADKFADVVRILLWGNGDLKNDIATLENVLAEYDSVTPKVTDSSRLERMTKALNPEGYAHLSGENWNDDD